MKKQIKLMYLSTLFTLSINIAEAKIENYSLDKFHSNARFAVDHFNTSTNVGGFYGLTGSLKFDQLKNTGKINISIPINKLQVGSKEFEEHLKSEDFFNEKKYPNIKFTSKKWNTKDNQLVSVEGDLTLLEKTNPVTLKVKKFNCYDSPVLKAKVCGGDFETTIDGRKWDVKYLVDHNIKTDIVINIQVEAVKK